ncbi:hypothetical protein [Candidatus Methylomirabilis sp.]|uniref:hypothetical protein n=1 Tax=Candidatus Methylomirabilis sp. TaxID=2032687 RepID=UPI0030760084
MAAVEFRFGVLPRHLQVDLPDWRIEPLPDCQETIEQWRGLGADTTWIYPPIVQWVRRPCDPGIEKTVRKQVIESEKEAVVWRLPPTHCLKYNGRHRLDRDDAMHGIATFLIYLLGTIYGIELQHEAWFVTGRQRKRENGLFISSHKATTNVLDLASRWFRKAPRKVQTAIVSALHLHNHISAYQWDWERFSWQYAVFDAAWFVAQKNGDIPLHRKKKHWPHGERFHALATAFNLRRNKRQFEKWVRNRNDLIHQLTWGKTFPGHEPKVSIRGEYLPLRSFCTIALLASIGYKGKSLRTRWYKPFQFGLEV